MNIPDRFLKLLKLQNSSRLTVPPETKLPADIKTGDSLYEREVQPVKAIYDPANSLLHFQTDPFFDGNRIVVKRLATYKVFVETCFQTVEEYDLQHNYSGDDK